jgi:hypothetical protein
MTATSEEMARQSMALTEQMRFFRLSGAEAAPERQARRRVAEAPATNPTATFEPPPTDDGERGDFEKF